MWDHVIKNGTVVTAKDIYKAHIYIRDEKIIAISKELLEGNAKVVTDASGQYVLPGLIDVHVHSRDPGATYKEDFYHSTMAAAAGGVTTLFEMPNTTPPTSTVENFNNQIQNLSPKAHVDFGLWAQCLGEINLHEIQGLSDAGAIGFKFFWGYAIDSNTFQLIYNYTADMDSVILPPDEGEIYFIFNEVTKTGKTLAIHAENHELIHGLMSRIEKGASYNQFLKGRPQLAEETTIQTAISFAKELGTKLHILHLTSENGLEVIKNAQQKGYPISAETCPHYLFLCDEDYEEIGSKMKVYPLVKSKKDQEALWRGIEEKAISIVCSDHAPHTKEEKEGDLFSIPAGMCGIETMVALMLNTVNDKKLSINEVVSVLSENPAKQFGIYPEKGSLQIGTDADITIVDLNKVYTLREENLHSKSKIMPFNGFENIGAPVQTILRGKTIMKNGNVVKETTGKFIHN